MLGLLWGSWMFELLARLAESSMLETVIPQPGLILGGTRAVLLAIVHFTIILAIVPRARLTLLEIVLPAVVGAVLWELARNLFGWLVGTDSYYLRTVWSAGRRAGAAGLDLPQLGDPGADRAVRLGVRDGAARARGAGRARSPRQAGLDGWAEPFQQDNAVNEAQQV